ncbi:MAG: hypothetical protein HY913_03125 [Desulfomonile tiedjei]|nr:hypothetical protein [Desulfomonile tiedjei]
MTNPQAKIVSSPGTDVESRGPGIWATPNPILLKSALLIALAVVHVLITLYFTVPGYLSIDEAVNHFMAKNFSQTWGLEIWNGYGEFPSPELSSRFLTPRDGRLVSQYPYLFPVLAFPLYRMLGFFGLFVLNSICFVGVVALCFAIGKKLFHDVDLALNSCLILVLATFSWEYSQAGWPHATAMLFVIAAFYLAVSAYLSEGTRKAIYLAGAAGIVAGFAPGVRMDAFLVFPALILPFLFARPTRFAEAFAVAVGAVPGLSVLAVTNLKKFGQLTPLSYGDGSQIPVYTTLAFLAVVTAAWVVTRGPFVNRVRVHRNKILVAGVVAACLLAVLPETGPHVNQMLNNLYTSLIDIRALDPNYAMPAAGRTPGGGVIYLGAHKKALLQSLPFLAILMIPVVRILRGDKDFMPLSLLLLVPISVTAFYCYNPHEYGGLCLNYRYFTTLLPFVAILSAYAIRELGVQWGCPFRWSTFLLVSFATLATYFLLTEELTTDLQTLEFTLLLLPLLMAGCLLVLLAAGFLLKSEGANVLRSAGWVVLTAAMSWSAAVAFLYDYPRHRGQRAINYSIGGQALQVVPADSILFTAPFIDPFMRLIEQDRVRIALPSQDNFADFPKIVEFYLTKGKRVFAVFPNRFWTSLHDGALASYTVTPVLKFPGSYLGEISRGPNSGKSPEISGAR